MLEITEINITPEILKLIAEIDEFKGKWQVIENLAPERLDNLKKLATIESVGSSTRIEGAKLSDENVEKLLSNLKTESFNSRDEQEVAGYADSMDMVFNSYNEIKITENHIKQLHGVLLKYSSKDEDHRGYYKTTANHVEAFDANGKNIGVIFETATPFDTPQMMADLVSWYNAKIEKNLQHPLIIIAVFILVFLAIHPFKDVNGRLSRILTTLLLLRNNYNYVIYSSMESIIEANKDNYYISLRRTQKSLKDKKQDWQPWLVYYLKTMVKQKNNLEIKIEEERSLVKNLPELSRNIMQMTKFKGEVSVKDIEDETQANRSTIKLHLKNLVEQNYLENIGKGRGAKYRLKT